ASFTRSGASSIVTGMSPGSSGRSGSTGCDPDERARATADLREHLEDHLQPVFPIEQLVRGAPLLAVNERGRCVEPRTLHVAAHVTDCDANLRVVANAFHLPRVGLGVDVESVVVKDEPDRRLHALAVLLERFERNVVLTLELAESRIGHATSRYNCRP